MLFFPYLVPFEMFVMIRLMLLLSVVGSVYLTPSYFGHLDPDINCVFHAIGRSIFSGGIFAEGGGGGLSSVFICFDRCL